MVISVLPGTQQVVAVWTTGLQNYAVCQPMQFFLVLCMDHVLDANCGLGLSLHLNTLDPRDLMYIDQLINTSEVNCPP
jgi:hypothetical protein